MKFHHLLILFITFFLLAACKEDDTAFQLPQFEAGAQLQRIISYPLSSSENSQVVEEYAYDSLGRLAKISQPAANSEIYAYRQYEYNDEGQLITISHFEGSSGDYINTFNQRFTYTTNGKKEKELLDNLFTGSSEYFLFIYDGDKLVETKKYGQDDELVYYIIYEHDQKGNVIKESTYDGEGNYLSSFVYSYSNRLLVKSISYAGEADEVVREDTRYYDKNNNLVILKSKAVAPWLSSVSYEHHYQYVN